MKKLNILLLLTILLTCNNSIAMSASILTPLWFGVATLNDIHGNIIEEIIPTGYKGKIITFDSEKDCLNGLINPAIDQNMNVIILSSEKLRTIVFKDGTTIDIKCLVYNKQKNKEESKIWF